MEPDADELAAMQARLLDLFRERGVRIAGDLFVCEAAAECALGLARGTLAQRYSRGTLPYEFRTEGNRRWYGVALLARVLVERRQR
jgi:hypothetical protein